MSIVSAALQWLGWGVPQAKRVVEDITPERYVVVVPASQFKEGDRVVWIHAMTGQMATGTVEQVAPHYGGYNNLYVRPDNEPTIRWHTVPEHSAKRIS